jgi:DNA-binding transcriptional LysR family regulator
MKSSERSFARRIDLTSLQLFVAVCELGSIGRAAEREFLAASAISKRLSDLETAVDTALLYRHSRGVTLTPAGESLLHHARTVLFGLERMQGELSEYAEGVRGHVRVHANISAIFQFLPEDLGTFARMHSQIKIDLQEHLSPEVLHAVQEGATDLGICNTGSHGASALQSRPTAPTGWYSSSRKGTPCQRETRSISKKYWTGTSSACTRAAASACPCAQPLPQPVGRCASASRSQAWMPCAA